MDDRTRGQIRDLADHRRDPGQSVTGQAALHTALRNLAHELRTAGPATPDSLFEGNEKAELAWRVAWTAAQKYAAARLGKVLDGPPAPGSAALLTEARYTTALDNATRALDDLDWDTLGANQLARTALDAAGLPAILTALADAETRAATANPETP